MSVDYKQIALSFLEIYYKSLSGSRLDLMQFYSPESCLTWEKNEFSGSEQIRQNLERMSATNLTYTNLNSDSQITPGNMILIHVSGYVSIDQAPQVPFSQTFLLQQSSAGSWFIRNEIFKFSFA